mmetsp:Transcript_131722/g.367211  ORF Transcript_131722/g.367211 Transcript_131722/m.367211 type:complete len:80 (-) Transcript_131722:1647-1886(-)
MRSLITEAAARLLLAPVLGKKSWEAGAALRNPVRESSLQLRAWHQEQPDGDEDEEVSALFRRRLRVLAQPVAEATAAWQ